MGRKTAIGGTGLGNIDALGYEPTALGYQATVSKAREDTLLGCLYRKVSYALAHELLITYLLSGVNNFLAWTNNSRH